MNRSRDDLIARIAEEHTRLAELQKERERSRWRLAELEDQLTRSNGPSSAVANHAECPSSKARADACRARRSNTAVENSPWGFPILLTVTWLMRLLRAMPDRDDPYRLSFLPIGESVGVTMTSRNGGNSGTRLPESGYRTSRRSSVSAFFRNCCAAVYG